MLQLSWQVRAQLRDARLRGLHEVHPPAQQLKEHAAQGKPIPAKAQGCQLPRSLIRRCVLRRPRMAESHVALPFMGDARLRHLRQTQVGDLGSALSADQDVGRL